MVFEMGSSERQVRHSTCFSGFGGAVGLELPKREPIMLAGRSLLLTEWARVTLGVAGSTGALDVRGSTCDVVWACRGVVVVLLRSSGGRWEIVGGCSRTVVLLKAY